MIQYDLEIRPHNQQAHIDIENDLQAKKNGLFTFIIRVNGGNIVDYILMEQDDGRKYAGITRVVVKKSFVSYDNRK